MRSIPSLLTASAAASSISVFALTIFFLLMGVANVAMATDVVTYHNDLARTGQLSVTPSVVDVTNTLISGGSGNINMPPFGEFSGGTCTRRCRRWSPRIRVSGEVRP